MPLFPLKGTNSGRRPTLWDHLLGSEVFQKDYLILGVDLNFSNGHSESWGHHAQLDPLSAYFENFLDSHNLLDIPSAKLFPTWRNNRAGENRLARRLDHFFIKEGLLTLGLLHRQWVGSGGVSNHLPIFMEISGGPWKPKGPFKFNSSWLKDPTYIHLINELWKMHPPYVGWNITEGFTHDLIEMKRLYKTWAHNKRIKDDQTLMNAEKEIVEFEKNMEGAYKVTEQKDRLTEVYAAKRKILMDREEAWRLRSRVIWLLDGDDNKKFYHKLANGRKSINTIWQLSNEQGHTVNTFSQLASLVTSHFKRTYRAPPYANLAEIIQVAQLFPRFVDQEADRELSKEITIGELKATIKWFKKDKSPGSSRWLIKFYLYFFETLGADLLKVLENSRTSGKILESFTSTFIALIPKSDNPSTFDDYILISLYNCIYKIMAKIIANRLRPILSKYISLEKFAFLQDHQIHEVMGTSQEVLHSLHSKKIKGMILKVDLSKAFDRANWLYIRMLLTHLGFPFDFIKWIMSCITNIPFNMLINRAVSPFFLF
eukprot:PITA_27834